MDGWIKNGRDKIFSRGPQIGPNVHYTDEKLKEKKETNRQKDRIRQYKKKKTLKGANEIQGSGSTKAELDPALASASASLFPWIP
jgi:hypothetical protein